MSDASALSLDGIRMHVVATASNGVVGTETRFLFRQRDRIVTAAYSGGRILDGFLAGKWEDAGMFFRYVQVTADGAVESGHSTAEVSQLDDGRLRLVEHFQWDSKAGTGTNVFEQI